MGVPEISVAWDRQATGFMGMILGDWIAPKLVFLKQAKSEYAKLQ